MKRIMKQYSNVLLALFGMFLIGISGWVYDWLSSGGSEHSGASMTTATVVFFIGSGCVFPLMYKAISGED